MTCAPHAGPSFTAVLAAALDRPQTLPDLSPAQWRILHVLRVCRTPALGGHQYRCQRCGRDHFVPHSCGNRHCPQCQGAAAARWLEAQEAVLLPVPYFHLVFTLPHGLNALVRQNRRVLYNLLFDAASRTLLTFGRNRFGGAQIGITAVLHTWGQSLIDHYHVHCLVTGGGWDARQHRWVHGSGSYLFPVRALSRVFQGKYLEGLQRLYRRGRLEFHGQLTALADAPQFQELVREVSRSAWVVYAKRPFAGPEQVLAYVGRYTHRVAISPRRLLSLDATEGRVCFDYKDYRDGDRHKTMTLEVGEFVRRFALHLLPPRFSKIRHYGLLAARGRQERLAEVKAALGCVRTPSEEPASSAREEPDSGGGEALLTCPYCGARALVLVEFVPRPRGRGLPGADTS